MKKLLTILFSIFFTVSQAFGNPLGFVSFAMPIKPTPHINTPTYNAQAIHVTTKLTESNIVVQSIKTALNDENDLGLKGAVKQYVKLDKQTAQVLASAVNEINGATNF